MRYVIVGACISGISAARSIWARDPAAQIDIISDEKTHPYYRPMIPFLIRKKDLDITIEDVFDKRSVDLIHDRAASIDIRGREVILASGKKCVFDKLLLAVGGGPVVPEIPGLKGAGAFTFRTQADSHAIRAYASGRRNVLVIGGGLIGMKAAIALKDIGMNVTVVEILPQILLQRIDKRGSEILSRVIKKSGINIITGDSVSEVIREGGDLRAARLSSGSVVDAQMIIAAVGARPRLDLVEGSGIQTKRGILVNEFLQTSVPEIYAAGDVVEYTDILTGRPEVSALWTNAEEMGRLAGKNMTGAGLKYSGFLSVMNSTEFYNIPVMSVGIIEPEGEGYEVITEDNIDMYKKLVFKGDVLVGAVFIGDAPNAGIYTSLIRNKIPIGDLKEEAISGSLGYVHFVKNVPPTLSA